MNNQRKFLILAVLVGIAGVGIGNTLQFFQWCLNYIRHRKNYNNQQRKLRFSQYIMGLTTFFIYPWDIENVVNQEEEV